LNTTFIQFIFCLLAFVMGQVSGYGGFATWKVTRALNAPGIDDLHRPTVTGLAFDGRYLWHAGRWNQTIYKMDPVSGRVLATFHTPVFYQEDLTIHRGRLYFVDANNDRIIEMNMATGALLDTIKIDRARFGPRIQTGYAWILNGLESDGRYLWTTFGGHYIAKINPETKEMVTFFPKSKSLEVTTYIDGLTLAWGHMFLSTNDGTIVELDMDGRLIEQFKAPSGLNIGPEGMAFDGASLWYADETKGKIYQIMLIDGYFR
jgi:outer membrane protein assembly factor BamB